MLDTYLPYIRKQSDLLAEFQSKLNINESSPRWAVDDFYAGMKEGLQTWDKMVLLPFWYTLPDGYTAGTYEYTLPSYIKPPIRAQIKRYVPYNDLGVLANASTWQDFPAHVEVDDTGFGQVLRVDAPPRSLDGRVGWMAPNSMIPWSATLPTVAVSSITSSSTSVTLDSAPEVSDVGIVDIGGEKIAYFGVTRSNSAVTLDNLTRGLCGTTAASHNTGITCEWCVAADDQSLYAQLYNYTAYALHRNKLSDGGTHESSIHQQMMLYHKQQADQYWQGYSPERPQSRLRLGRKKFMR